MVIFRVVRTHIWLGATMLDNVDIEYFHHCTNSIGQCWVGGNSNAKAQKLACMWCVQEIMTRYGGYSRR